MSDIVIRNMKMPKSCLDCELCYDNIHCVITETSVDYSVDDFKANDCPLVELPPHGRLIDADALPIHIIQNRILEKYLVVDVENIHNAPTILEASKEDEERRNEQLHFRL